MIFEGLAPDAVFRIFGAAAAVLVALYLLRVRRRRVQVPFAKLWNRVVQPSAANAWWRWLKRLFSLLLQLIVAALIALALGKPIFPAGELSSPLSGCRAADAPPSPEMRHTVLVVDTTASLGATDVPGGRLGAALDAARRVIDSREPQEHILLATASGGLSVLSPFLDDSAALLDLLVTGVRPQPRGGALAGVAPALKALLAGRAAPRVVLVTDGDAPPWPAGALGELAWEAVVVAPREARLSDGAGAVQGNLAVAAFEARPYLDDPLTYELYLRVANHGPVATQVDVALASAGQGDTPEAAVDAASPFEALVLDVPAQGEVEHVLRHVEVPAERVLVRIRPREPQVYADALAADDLGLAVLPPRRRLRVQLVSPGNLYVEAALFVREQVSYEWIRPEQWQGPGSYDLTILDRFVPPGPLPAGNYLILAPPADHSPVAVDVSAGPVAAPELRRVADAHPIVWKVSFEDLNVGSMARLVPAPGDVVLAASTDGAPAMVLHQSQAGVKAVVWAFDVANSDLPLRYAFPLLLVNTLGWFYAEEATLRSGRVAGEDWALPLPVGSSGSGPPLDAIDVRSPRGGEQRAPVVEGRALVHAGEVGFWTIDPNGEAPWRVASSFRSPEESALRLADAQWPIWVPPAPRRDEMDAPAPLWSDVWRLALVAAAAILVLEWWTYQRRMTV